MLLIFSLVRNPSVNLSNTIPAQPAPVTENRAFPYQPGPINEETKTGYDNAESTAESAKSTGIFRNSSGQTSLDSQTIQLNPEEFETVVEFFDKLKHSRNLTDQELASNLRQWQTACNGIRAPKGMILPEFSSDQYRPLIERFEKYCTGIDFASELAGAESLHQNLDSLLSGDTQNSFADGLKDLTRKQAIVKVVRELRLALGHLDADKVQALLMTLVMENLYPPHETVSSENMLLNVSHQVAQKLICRRLNGCRGAGHPFVLRYCFIMYPAGRLCELPNGMDEAIFQTLTPVEYQQYSAMVSWINAELRKSIDQEDPWAE